MTLQHTTNINRKLTYKYEINSFARLAMSGCFLTNENEVHCTACHRTVNLVTANIYLSRESFTLHLFHEEKCDSFLYFKHFFTAKTHKKQPVTETLPITDPLSIQAPPTMMSNEQIGANPAPILTPTPVSISTPPCAIQPPILITLGTLKNPRHPNYSDTKNRLNTYKKWPVTLVPTSESLASAGFFHNNNGDEVICFCCGNYLYDWESNDDVWKEHARWFPQCEFVIQIMGEKFVTSIQKEIQSETDLRHASNLPTPPRVFNNIVTDYITMLFGFLRRT